MGVASFGVLYRVRTYFGACHKKVRYKQHKRSISGNVLDLSHPSVGLGGNGKNCRGDAFWGVSSLQRFLLKNSWILFSFNLSE